MNKLLLVITASLLGTTLFAQTPSTKLKSDDVRIYNADVELLQVYTKAPKCPINAMCAPVAIAKIKITFSGCMDRLVKLSTNTVQLEEGAVLLNVAAISAASKKSATTRCIVMPSQTEEVFVGAAFLVSTSSVELNVLK